MSGGSGLSLAVRQVRYTNKAFWRNPASAFFTFAFPLMFLVIFTALLGGSTLHIGILTVKSSTYYVASMASFSVVSACFTNIAMSVSFQREEGILKRIRGTPIPGWSYLLARIIQAVVVAAILVAICAAFGKLFYGADLPKGSTLLRFAAMLLVGSAAFTALGLATTCIVPNADAAPAVVNAIILPLLFLSGIFIPITNKSPGWIVWVGRIFPVKHFTNGMSAGFFGAPFAWKDVAVVAVWGIAGLLVAAKFFSWEPRK